MEKKIMTVAEFAELNGVDKLMAGGFIGFLESKGIVTKVGTRKVEGARGKPSNLFEIPTSVTASLVIEKVESPKVEAPKVEVVETATTEVTAVETAKVEETVG